MNIHHEMQERIASDRRKKVNDCIQGWITFRADRRQALRRAKDKDNAFVNTWLETYHAARRSNVIPV
jgi:hypothetical protein